MAKTKIELFEDSLIEEGLHFFLLCQKESSFAKSFVDHELVNLLGRFKSSY